MVSVADSKRAPAARSSYHEIGDDLEPRAGVHWIRELQREYAREQERERGPELEL